MAKLMFLEDQAVIREVLCEYIRMDGHEVLAFERGDAALAALAEQRFDLAVLDINVPGLSGLELLRHIRAREGAEMGVIMLTAYDDLATQIEAFNAFADDYITKPVSPIILLKRIDVLLRRIARSLTPPSASLHIDAEAYRAYYEGRDLKLTLSEFLLLKTLSAAPDRVFSRAQLLRALYDEEYVGSDRIVDAHIKNIRKKGPLKELETVIGLGYRWRKDT